MKINKFFSVIVAGFLLTACSNSSDEYSAEQKEEIKVTAEINGMLTRAVQNAANLQDAAFATGSSFRLYLTSGGSAIAGTPAAGYFTVTKNSSNYTFDTPAYFPSYNTSVDAFAIYPSTVSNGQATFSIVEDQQGEGQYKSSDLMYAYKAANTAGNGDIPLQFNHCLCKIVIQVVNSDNTPSNELDGYDVTLDDLATTIGLSFSGNKISTVDDSETDEAIIGFGQYGGNGVSAIVVPQLLTPADYFYFKDSSNTLSYWIDMPMELEAGNVYTFKLKVEKASLYGSYSVKPWTNTTEDIEGELSRD